MERVFATLAAYRDAMDAAGVPADARVAVLTSAARDAANGADFTAHVTHDYGLDARTIAGEEEARLTFRGATHNRDRDDATPLLVLDVGGGSTELIVGARRTATSRVPRLAASRRRAPDRAPPAPRPAPAARAAAARRRRLARRSPQACRRTCSTAPGRGRRRRHRHLAAPRSTRSSSPTTRARVHGYVLERAEVELLLARLAQMPLAQRRQRAPACTQIAPRRSSRAPRSCSRSLRAFDLRQRRGLRARPPARRRARARGRADQTGASARRQRTQGVMGQPPPCTAAYRIILNSEVDTCSIVRLMTP